MYKDLLHMRPSVESTSGILQVSLDPQNTCTLYFIWMSTPPNFIKV